MSVLDAVVALHHPVRRRINEALRMSGPATVGRLVEGLGVPFGSVSHHLRVMAKAGLVEQAPELATDGRQSWWRSVPQSLAWSVDQFSDPLERAAAVAAEVQNADYEQQQVRTWQEHKDGEEQSWREAAWATNGWIVASAEDLAELGRRINELVAEYADRRQPGDADTKPVFVLARGFPGTP